MEEKSVNIVAPKGYEIDKRKSTFQKIVFKKKGDDYNSIAEKLFKNNCTYYITENGDVSYCKRGVISTKEPNNCTSQKQAEKLLAINKLMNVAKYLNGDWKPDWENVNCKYAITCSDGFIVIQDFSLPNISPVYFKSAAIAEKAIDILGEDTIKLALSTDW